MREQPTKLSWWAARTRLEKIGIIAGALTVVTIVFLAGLDYSGHGTPGLGFSGSATATKETTNYNSSNPTEATSIAVTQEPRPAKTLWDWLQLLIIPVAVAIGTFVLNQAVKRREETLADQRAKDNVLQSYFNEISTLLADTELSKRLRDLINTEGDDIRLSTRARTLTALEQLDGVRKRSVLQFFYEADLLRKNHVIVDLRGANLSRADLRGVDLRGVNLTGADLRRANLRGANLIGADLSRAELSEVTLAEANLRAIAGRDGLADIVIKTNLSMTTLIGADLRGANLRGAVLSDANLSGSDLRGADMDGADLSRADLSGSDLSGANLRGAHLREAKLIDSCLIGSNLIRASLTEADLKGADLRGAHLMEADLSMADLDVCC